MGIQVNNPHISITPLRPKFKIFFLTQRVINFGTHKKWALKSQAKPKHSFL